MTIDMESRTSPRRQAEPDLMLRIFATRRKNPDMTARDLARRFGLSEKTISDMLRKKLVVIGKHEAYARILVKMPLKSPGLARPYEEETWLVKRGFGRAFKEQIEKENRCHPAENAEIVRDVLRMVGVTAEPELIKRWPKFRRIEAMVWAQYTTLRAGDNIVPSYSKPGWIPDGWGSPVIGEGIWETRQPTPITSVPESDDS